MSKKEILFLSKGEMVFSNNDTSIIVFGNRNREDTEPGLSVSV